MKKLFILLLAGCLMACGNTSLKYGQSGVNACQYAKENIGVLEEDISSVEIVKIDTLLYSHWIRLGFIGLYNSSRKYRNGEITKEEYEKDLKYIVDELDNISKSWAYGDVFNDSLRKVEGFDNSWRRVYTVKLTMKSGTSKECRVIMSSDGQKPEKTEDELARDLEEFQEEWSRLWHNFKY